MNPEIIESIVGIVISTLGAGLAHSRTNAPFLAVLAIGLAATALYVAIVPDQPPDGPPTLEAKQRINVTQTRVVAHTRDQNHLDKDWSLTAYTAPSVPDQAMSYELLDLECNAPTQAVAAWSEVVESHPNADILHSVDATVHNGRTYLSLRSREHAKGYAHIDVLAICIEP